MDQPSCPHRLPSCRFQQLSRCSGFEVSENLHIGRVIYGDEATERRHRLVIERAAEITSRHGHAHVDAVRRVGPVRYLRTIVDEVVASQLIWNCLTAKRMRYANEREVRYLVLNLRGNSMRTARRSVDGHISKRSSP